MKWYEIFYEKNEIVRAVTAVGLLMMFQTIFFLMILFGIVVVFIKKYGGGFN